MLWMCACRPRVMRLCGMEVFFWGHPSTQLARAGFFLSFFFCFLFNIWLSVCFLTFGSTKSMVWMGVILFFLYPPISFPLESVQLCCTSFFQFLLNLFPYSLSTSQQKVCLITEKWLSRRQWHLSCILRSLIVSMCVCEGFSCCSAQSNALQEKMFLWMGCLHVLVWEGAKGRLSWVVFHSRSQGLEGVFGLSGVEDFREREKQRDRRGETDGQRWVAWQVGRRQKKVLKKTREDSTR